MKKVEKTGNLNSALLRNIAMVSAGFAVIMCVLIIINFIQVKRADPLNAPVLKAMIERLHTNPGDGQLRQEIRELDLLARKAFFTNQWQVRMGGYLLFLSLLIVVICLKAIELLTKISPAVPSGERADFWQERKINRSWVAYTGIALVAVSMLLVFLTHHELGKSLDVENAGNPSNPSNASNAGNANNAGKAGLKGEVKADSAGKAPGGVTDMDGFPTVQEVAANFTSFRGPGGNGIVFRKNIPTSWDGKSGKNILWKTGVPLPGYNSPIIWNDRIFLTGANET
ncbi:MAG: hypothetical protein WCK34_14455, partial [Bacteroidota bacterium]